ncbi:hypothetical protein OAI07_01195 [Akkermansiaceae bacterium]|nr:hypothetical protein [Akkermansiaceae bacterium]
MREVHDENDHEPEWYDREIEDILVRTYGEGINERRILIDAYGTGKDNEESFKLGGFYIYVQYVDYCLNAMAHKWGGKVMALSLEDAVKEVIKDDECALTVSHEMSEIWKSVSENLDQNLTPS